jgi:hypothetical protein
METSHDQMRQNATASTGMPRRFGHQIRLASASWAPQGSRRDRQLENLIAARARAFAASISRFLGAELVSSEARSLAEVAATSSTAARNAASFACDGLLKPLIFLTNCSEAERISSSVTGGAKLKSVFMFLHTGSPQHISAARVSRWRQNVGGGTFTRLPFRRRFRCTRHRQSSCACVARVGIPPLHHRSLPTRDG